MARAYPWQQQAGSGAWLTVVFALLALEVLSVARMTIRMQESRRTDDLPAMQPTCLISPCEDLLACPQGCLAAEAPESAVEWQLQHRQACVNTLAGWVAQWAGRSRRAEQRSMPQLSKQWPAWAPVRLCDIRRLPGIQTSRVTVPLHTLTTSPAYLPTECHLQFAAIVCTPWHAVKPSRGVAPRQAVVAQAQAPHFVARPFTAQTTNFCHVFAGGAVACLATIAAYYFMQRQQARRKPEYSYTAVLHSDAWIDDRPPAESPAVDLASPATRQQLFGPSAESSPVQQTLAAPSPWRDTEPDQYTLAGATPPEGVIIQTAGRLTRAAAARAKAGVMLAQHLATPSTRAKRGTHARTAAHSDAGVDDMNVDAAPLKSPIRVLHLKLGPHK